MDLKTPEHTCGMYGEWDCKLCDEVRQNCRARRREQYLRDFDEWSKEAIDKMEEKFKKFETLTKEMLYNNDKSKTMIVQFDDNLNEHKYWIKRFDNEYEKEIHWDSDYDVDLQKKILDYLEYVKDDFREGDWRCDCKYYIRK